MDYVGYALISGGENNGNYVDKNGNLFRLQDGKMISVTTGAAISATTQEQEGKLIVGIQPRQLELPGGKGTEAPASPEQLAAEAAGEGKAVASDDVHVEEPESVQEETHAPLEGGERVNAILTDLTPDEIRAMLYAAKNRGMDVAVLQGDDEMTTRKNAETLARVTTE